MKRIRSLAPATFIVLAFVGYAFLVSAAAPSGGYTPGATLDPDCAPGDTDCIVQSSGGGGVAIGDLIGNSPDASAVLFTDMGGELAADSSIMSLAIDGTFSQTRDNLSFVNQASGLTYPGQGDFDFVGTKATGLDGPNVVSTYNGVFNLEDNYPAAGMFYFVDYDSAPDSSSGFYFDDATPYLFAGREGGEETRFSLGYENVFISLPSVSLAPFAAFSVENGDGEYLFGVGNQFSQFGQNSTDVSSAILSLNSTTQGFLMPRMTESERDAIDSPATGLQIYNTDDNEFNYYNGSAWVVLGGGGGSSQWSDVASGYTLNQVQGSGLDDVTVSGNYNYSVELAIQIVGNAGDTMLELGSYTEPFSNGQTVTGQTSGATATVHNFTEFGPHLFLEGVSGTFIPGEVITNNDNAGTADVVSTVVTTSDSFLWLLSDLSQFAAVQMTGSAQILFDSFSATWASTTGHTIGDQWLLTIQQSGIAYNSGVVGIGTVSPAADFTVEGGSILRDVSGDESVQLLLDGDGEFLFNPALLLSYNNSVTGDSSGFIAFEGVSRMFAGVSGTTQIELEEGGFQVDMDGFLDAFYIDDSGFDFFSGTQWGASAEEDKFFFDLGTASGTKSIRLGSVDDDNWDSGNRGDRSIAIGFAIPSFSVEAPLATGDYSIALGSGATASGIGSLARGFASIASGAESIALGGKITASGDLSFAIGNWNTAFSYNEAVLGAFATEYIPVSAVGWDTADRLFNIGNGNGPGTESDAFTILKSGQIGIGIDNFEASADASALLTLGSTTQGFLAPRMTEAQRDAILSPATGLFAYNTDTNKFNFYNGSVWSSNLSGLTGSTSTIGTETWLGAGVGSSGGTSVDTVFIGRDAGSSATNTEASIFVGNSAGVNATNARYSLFLGAGAGTNATDASFSIFIGLGSGVNDTTTGSSILIGNYTSTGGYSNSIALGTAATNTASNQLMIGSLLDSPIDFTVIKGTGGTECTITTGTGIACTSDIRLKTNIQDLSGSTLEDLLNVRTVTYNWKSNPNGDNMIGFLAQDLEQYFPELVSTNERGQKSVYYAQMTPVLVEAIRELDLKISDFQDVSEGSTFGDMLRGWFADAANGIQKIFVKEVQTDKLCVGERCITEDQFNQLLDSVDNPGFYSSDDQAPAFTDPVPEVPAGESADETIDEPQAPVADPVTEPAPEPEPIPEPEAPVVESTPTE